MFRNPKVSVIVHTYNYARFLDETIGSVLNQTFTDFELIIVDNCSTDNTDVVVEKYLSDPRVFYHKNEKNLGISGNMNKGIQLARGEYLKFLCADDKFHPQLLEKFVPVLDENPGVSLVTCDKEVFGDNSFTVNIPLKGLQNGTKAVLNTLNTDCWIGEPSSVMVRRKNMEVVGEFVSDNYIMYMDWEMWLRQLAVGDCYIIPEVLIYIRHQANQHGRRLKHMKYVIVFEEYQLARDIEKKKHIYHISETDRELKRALRKRAANCVKVGMIKILPDLYLMRSWPVFCLAAQIGFREGVFGAIAVEAAKKGYTRIVRTLSLLVSSFM